MKTKTKLLDKKKFDKLPANQKRVVICQDVLARIKARLIAPDQGDLLHQRGVFSRAISPQETFNSKKCAACAKGALICSWVGNFNKVSWGELGYFDYDLRASKSYPPALLRIFGRKMLDNMEAAFEQSPNSWSYSSEETKPYRTMFKNGSKGLLQKIMKRIIKNDGAFPPPSNQSRTAATR
jgi:hypothetical protein